MVRKSLARGFFGFRMRSNINMGTGDEHYRPILKVPQYQEKLKKVARKMTGFALLFSAAPALGLYSEYILPSGIALYFIYAGYERVMSSPMFSKLIYEIYVNEKDPNLIKFRTHNGYFKGQIDDIEPLMNVVEAKHNLNLQGRDKKTLRGLKPEESGQAAQQALPQSADPKDTYFVDLKNEVHDAYNRYLMSDKKTPIDMSKDTRQFVFTIRMKDAQELYFVGLTWGLNGMILDKDALMKVISGGSYTKSSYFTTTEASPESSQTSTTAHEPHKKDQHD